MGDSPSYLDNLLCKFEIEMFQEAHGNTAILHYSAWLRIRFQILKLMRILRLLRQPYTELHIMLTIEHLLCY